MTTGAEGSTQSAPAVVYGRHGTAVRCAVEGRDAGTGGRSWRACPYVGRRPYSLPSLHFT